MRIPVVAAAAIASLVLTACGSTLPAAQVTQQGAALDGSGLGGASQVVGTGTGGTSGGFAGATGSTGASTTGGVAAGPSQAGTGAGTTGAAGTPSASQLHAPIEVGILLYPNLDTFAKSFGASANTGDQDLITETAVKWVNAHGGAHGHPIKVIKHYVDLTSSDTYDQLAEQACQDFTVDHHAVAVLAPGTAVSTNFAECLQKRGALLNISGHWVHDAQDWQRYPNMWSPGEVDGARLGVAMVDQVVARGLAKRGDKVGLMVMTEPGAKRTADNVITPRLKAAGIDVVAYEVPPPASTADISNSVAVNNSAVLKLAAENIKTVMFLCPGCLGFFAQQASSQGYYPRYLATSFDSIAGLKGSNNEQSFKDSIALGWEPDKDVGVKTEPGLVAGNKTRALCRRIMDPIRQSMDDTSEYVTQVVCDGFLQIAYAADLNPAASLTGASLGVGMSRMGSSYPSALNFSTLLGPQLHGGASTYRTMRWDSGKQAFAYDSAPRRFP